MKDVSNGIEQCKRQKEAEQEEVPAERHAAGRLTKQKVKKTAIVHFCLRGIFSNRQVQYTLSLYVAANIRMIRHLTFTAAEEPSS